MAPRPGQQFALPGIWLNTGHGAGGWALACSCARAFSEHAEPTHQRSACGAGSAALLNPRFRAHSTGAASTHNVGYSSSVNCGTARPAMQRITPDQTYPCSTPKPPAAWSKPWPPSWRLTPDAACWPGCGATGASHCTTCPHDLDCLRPRQQRWRRAGGCTPFGRAGRKVVISWLGTTETLPPDARQSWEKARHCANMCGPTHLHRSDGTRPVH